MGKIQFYEWNPGLSGFVALLASISTGGFLFHHIRFGNVRDSKNNIEWIVVIVVVVLGLYKCITTLYSFVSKYADRVLADARFLVTNVQ